MGSQESQACPGRRGESTCRWAPKACHAPQRRLQTVQEDEVRTGDEAPPAWPGQASRKAKVNALRKTRRQVEGQVQEVYPGPDLSLHGGRQRAEGGGLQGESGVRLPLSLGCCSEREQVCVEEAVSC